MYNEIVFDIETKKSFQEVGGKQNMHLLGVSVVGTYSYKNDSFFAFEEKDFPEMERLFRDAGRIIGFNSKHFDVPVLQPHVSVNLREIPHLDLMENVESYLGFRISLDNLAKMNLGVTKSGHGMQALEWWKDGNIEAIKKYCLDDVRITRDLYELGKKGGSIVAETRTDPRVAIPVSWRVADNHPLQVQGSLF